MKKILSLTLCAALLGSVLLTGCGGNTDNRPATASEDKYRNYYEIFTQSYCDSDNDGTGDLKGIISQLDYLNDGDPNQGDDLGIDGIWLTPIMPSSSYHKYDVEDYYNIDPAFGTLETFDELVEQCHKRGIRLIIDLVLNHISAKHPLFTQAALEAAEGKLDGAAKYFEIHPKDYFSESTQVVSLGDYACEANFSLNMPEWNLNSEATREEFTKIAKFWLDRGVDGFRLDACLYYKNKETDGKEFLEWFVKTCRDIKSDVYIVGETWSGDADIEELYKSGIDSQFAFKYATTSGSIVEMLNTQKGKSLVTKVSNYDKKMREANPDEINAMFLSNHDQTRIANALASKGLDYEKFAASVYMLFPGNSFIYYGEEIGMTAPSPTGDANYRTPMVFDSENPQKITVDTLGDTFDPPANGGVKQQVSDKKSLLNFYRKVIRAKLQNPEISRGQIQEIVDMGDDTVGAFITAYEGKQVMVIHNFDNENAKELTIPSDKFANPELAANLVTGDENATLNGGTLKLPAHGSVILRQKGKEG
ncbi:MAG: hypothetical protein IJ598_08440 [Ruminococcus sp.]|nr:hypothetical protein [Ruminococcus sp.]